jgi:AcrR family transcriptional regulator
VAPPERASRRGGNSREAILDAAAQAILDGGARALRVADVADRAGVSTPLLYYHFASRASLVRAALAHAAQAAPSAAMLGADGRGYDVVRAALMADLQDAPAVHRSAVLWNEVTTLAAFEPELREGVRDAIAAWERAVAAAIDRGIGDGSVAADVDAAAAAGALTALIDGVSARWLAGALELPAAREQLALTVRALLAPE